MNTYSHLESIPLRIESYELQKLEMNVSSDFTRVSTVVRLQGGGAEGVGEDVTYEADDQTLLQEAGPALPLAGTHTLSSFSGLLDEHDLFPKPPNSTAAREYRRWAFESAALDLALRQAGRSLAQALGREVQPVRFVVSKRINVESGVGYLLKLRGQHDGLCFKLDPTSDWTEALIAEIAAIGAVEVLDFKGAYKGTIVDQAPDPVLYGRIAEAFPRAWLEDPALTDETCAVLEPHWDRVTWDAPIHSVGDIERLDPAPRAINIKPSRFGRLNEVFAAYDYCMSQGILLYGGGQFELGPGRGQIQYLASLFHSDAPNDVAPGGYHEPEPPPDTPSSPLVPAAADTGFTWETA